MYFNILPIILNFNNFNLVLYMTTFLIYLILITPPYHFFNYKIKFIIENYTNINLSENLKLFHITSYLCICLKTFLLLIRKTTTIS